MTTIFRSATESATQVVRDGHVVVGSDMMPMWRETGAFVHGRMGEEIRALIMAGEAVVCVDEPNFLVLVEDI